MSRRERLRGALAMTATLLASAPLTARANGAFPSSGQILVDPTDASRVGVRTTFGLVSTTDGGESFQWTCESALGAAGAEHPQLGITPTGVVFGGSLDGMVRGALGGCTWARVPSLEGRSVTDVSVDADGRAIAAVVPAVDARAEVWASDDDAATWAQLGAPLPAKLRPLTLDAAPSDPRRLYVSGLVDGTTVRGAIAVSADAGATWSLTFLPDSDASKAPYLAAVDPRDADHVWVRLDAAPGELLVSRDGGATWTVALLVEGFLRAFALSPGGDEVIAGGDADGLFRANADALDWAPMTPVAARCAKWRGDAIDVCGTESIDGFTVGRSTDDGATFEPYFVQRCLAGPASCAAETPVGACAAQWPAVREQIGAGACGEGGAGATAGTSVGSGSVGAGDATEASADATGATAATGDPTAPTGSGGGANDARGEGDGCSCRSTPEPAGATIAARCAALTTMIVLGLRRRPRPRRGESS